MLRLKLSATETEWQYESSNRCRNKCRRPTSKYQRRKKAFGLVPETKVTEVSFVYETEPWGYDQQDNFLNCVMTVETNLSSRALLGVCLGIEAGIGRVRTIKNGPRVIDLDLLFYENETADTPELMLPHPGVKERAFVLYPLHDIFPDMKIFGYDYSENFKNCDGNTVTFYSEL